MARLFNGTSDRMQSAATWNLTGSTKLTICWWMYVDNFGINLDNLAWESSANFNSNPGGIICNASPSTPTGKINFSIKSTTSVYNSAVITQPSAGHWHHYAVTVDLSQWTTSAIVPNAIQAVYVDGALQTLGTNGGYGTGAPTGFGNYTWNFFSRNGSSLFLAGRMAEFALYTGINLTVDQINAVMRKGPLRVAPGNLFRYIPTWGQATPEADLSGNAAGLNVTGTTSTGHGPSSRFTDMVLSPRNVILPSSTAYVTNQAGNWSNPLIWTPNGTPAAGDSATINHAVTVDANESIGVNGSTSLTINAALTVAAGKTFTVAGNVVQANAAFTLSAGSGLVFDTTAGNVKWLFGDVANFTAYANCGLVANGTSGSHCTVSKTGSNFCWFDDFSENSGSGADKTGYDCTYTDFTGIGVSGGAYSLGANTFGAKNLRLSHCKFDNCGTVWTPRPYQWNSSTNDWYVRDCQWVNTASGVKCLKAINGTGTTSGFKEILRSAFDRTFDINGNGKVESNLFEHGCVFLGGTPVSITGNLWKIGNGDSDQTVPASVSNSYWLAGLDHPGNPHCLTSSPASTSVTGCLFEFPIAQAIDSGECVYSGNGSITVTNCIALPSEMDGKGLGNVAHHSGLTGTGWTVEHNTSVGTSSAFIAYTEAGSNPAAPMYASVKSNLAVDPSGATAAIVEDVLLNTTDIILAANVDKNGKFGPVSYADPTCGQTLSGYHAHFTTAPGGTDITANPNFVDTTRNFGNWAVHKGAALAGDTLTVRYNASLGLLRADPTLIASDLIPWVRGGFAPTNSVYKNAGHDGADTGAVAGVFSTLPASLYYRQFLGGGLSRV